MGRPSVMKLVQSCALLALVVFAVDTSGNEVVDLRDTHAPDLSGSPNQAECDTVQRTMPALCKVVGRDRCDAYHMELKAKCGTQLDEADEIGEASTAKDAQALTEEAHSYIGVGRRSSSKTRGS